MKLKTHRNDLHYPSVQEHLSVNSHQKLNQAKMQYRRLQLLLLLDWLLSACTGLLGSQDRAEDGWFTTK
ncbi:hypothetical protein MRB53_040008 [Persea americana]|nr:hypothetical protein MRB53_040008 [Persea americana]